ncbi:hypothetical protein [Streptomyces sp. 3213.3]|uniref:hypothetical protein n=1 Tax=Streptomyces sp. 3213.3 TaxID=1855348 RepID=UPI001041D6D8
MIITETTLIEGRRRSRVAEFFDATPSMARCQKVEKLRANTDPANNVIRPTTPRTVRSKVPYPAKKAITPPMKTTGAM